MATAGYEWEKLSIGSDESGKGDFFGGPVVVAVKLDQETLEALRGWQKENGKIQDSKNCKDDWIKENARKLMSMCRHEIIELTPEQYNRAYDQCRNMNVLFACLHNKVHSKIEGDEPRIVDAFAKEELYRKYLRAEGVAYTKIDHMEHKAESKYMSVALASIIARFKYMEQMDRLHRESGVDIPYGNSYVGPQSVVVAYKKLMDKYSTGDWNRKFVKMNFSTLDVIKRELGI